MEPRAPEKRRTTKPRLTNLNRNEINEYGLHVPSKNTERYKPNINANGPVVLLHTGMLPGTRRYNYENKARASRNAARKHYMEQRAKLAALPPVTPNGKSTRKNKKNIRKNNNNNGTKRALF